MENNMMSNAPMQGAPMQQKPAEGINKNLALICLTVVVVCAIISATFLFMDSNKNNTPANNNQPGDDQPTGPIKVSIDDDAVLGNPNAPVTMIEFSDYECPFCKRHFTDVFPQIKKDYIDTGKLKLVFRDFVAVSGHNPLATSEAIAAQCAKELGGDSMYFKYHDALFTKTTSNGNGLLLSDLPVLAKNLGLNVVSFNQCLTSQKVKDEVAKDNADAGKVLPSPAGTPSFFIGKSSADGVINGTLVVGAQPFANFQTAIEAALAQ